MRRINTAFSFIAMAGACILGCTSGDQSTAPARSDQPGQPGQAASAPPSPAAGPEVITTKTGIEMVSIPGGEFTMGDDQGEDDEKPAHRVRISPFLMDRHEVTQESYRSLTGNSLAKFSAPDRPEDRVSWVAAIRYCNMRSLREGLKECYDLKTFQCDFQADGYRLPTEAEWEYACRAGTGTRYSYGNESGQLARHGWFKGNSGKATHPVKQKEPNPWGLYDMYGNVAEWCQDYYSSESYGHAAEAQDPRGPAAGQERVLRGGSWSSNEESCRSSARASTTPAFADACFGSENYGFRCVRKASKGPLR